MNLNEPSGEVGTFTRRRLLQLGAAGAASLSAPRVTRAAETAAHRSTRKPGLHRKLRNGHLRRLRRERLDDEQTARE